MILLVGATGLLGSAIGKRLVEDSLKFRALVRPGTDADALSAAGAEIVRGDLREPATLGPALVGVDAVISTANVISRVLGGETDLTIHDVDEQGNANLVQAAEAAGVERFVFLSFQDSILESGTPFALAKAGHRATARRLPDA
jgi:uncharacterized protein YbjT (DUF2867 family)